MAHITTRRNFVKTVTAGAALARTAFAVAPSKGSRSFVKNGGGLRPSSMYLLPLGAIRPTGWIRRQLEIQGQGLSGYLDETWPDVGPNSGWKGGIGESWERGPYYADGLLPLGYLLEDDRIVAKANQFVDWTLKSQKPDGNFGPASGKEHWWPRMVMLKVLTQHFEATGDSRVVPFMEAYFRYQKKNLPGDPLRTWARFRWEDNLLSVFWLYNRNGDRSLLELANLLQKQGYDWTSHYRNFKYTQKVTRAEFEVMRKIPDDGHHPVHGVDVAMGLKTTALWSLMPNGGDGNEVVQQWETLDRYHGMPNGIYSADELLAGTSPTQGTELCTVVEAMFSIEQALAVTGNSALGDRLEKIAYNALPGTISEDMWSHQYDQQPNQIECGLHTKPWTINGPEANLFGLEPNFGCCTANYHQGWPKLSSSLWMATADDGLAAVVYAPCVLETQLRGGAVRLDVQTDYPFRNTVAVRVSPAEAMEFPLMFRIPADESTPKIVVNGSVQTAGVKNGFLRLQRRWAPGDTVTLEFAMKPRVLQGHENSISVMRGPLVFSLPIEERWDKLRQRGLTADWAVYGQSPWNYALPSADDIKVKEHPIAMNAFAKASPPVTLEVAGTQVKNWRSADGFADSIPVEVKAGDSKTLELAPYASTKLRITAFPKA